MQDYIWKTFVFYLCHSAMQWHLLKSVYLIGTLTCTPIPASPWSPYTHTHTLIIMNCNQTQSVIGMNGYRTLLQYTDLHTWWSWRSIWTHRSL